MCRKSDQHGPNLGLKMEPKSMKKGRKSVNFSMPLEIDFLCDFGGFLVEKWRQVGTNMDPKSMRNAKSDVVKKPSFSIGKNHTFERSGGQSWDENSIKNRSKNELNNGRSLGIDV